MPAASELITTAMRLGGLLEAGQSPKTSEYNDGLTNLNAMIGMWNTQSWVIPFRTERSPYTVTAAAHSFTVGPAGTITTNGILSIEGLAISINGQQYDIRPGSLTEYNDTKRSIATLPPFYYFEPSAGGGTLYFPYKLDTTMQIIISYLAHLTTYATTSTDNTLPEGYEDAITYNLAVRLAPQHNLQVLPDVKEQAIQSLDWLMTQSLGRRQQHAKIDPTISAIGHRGRSYNGIIDR